MEKKRVQGDSQRARPSRMTLSLRFGRSQLVIRYGTADENYEMGYNPRKAAQVIAYYALKTGEGSIDFIKAIKLVYLGDRERVARWGEPILNEPRVALPNGPANDLTYAYAKGDRKDPEGWSAFLEDRRGNTLCLKPGVSVEDLDELSEIDMESLDAVWNRVGFMRPMALCGWTHKGNNVPEWKDPEGSSRPIPLERMMDAVGVTNPSQSAVQFEQRRSIAEILGDK